MVNPVRILDNWTSGCLKASALIDISGCMEILSSHQGVLPNHRVRQSEQETITGSLLNLL